MKPTAKGFKEYLKEKLQANPKTSWGKNELRLHIEELYAEFIEAYLEE